MSIGKGGTPTINETRHPKVPMIVLVSMSSNASPNEVKAVLGGYADPYKGTVKMERGIEEHLKANERSRRAGQSA